MEISFLEIFHKQGIFGLLFWFSILVIILKAYSAINDLKLKKAALPLVLSIFFVYIQSFTNPFANNPIGISIIVIAIVCIFRLKEADKAIEKVKFS